MRTAVTGAGECMLIHRGSSFHILRRAGREVERNRNRKAGLRARPSQVRAGPAQRCWTDLGADCVRRRYSPLTSIETVSSSCGCCAAITFSSFGREK